MQPNQPPTPTTTGSGTTPTVTQTTAGQGGGADARVVQAAVSVANTALLPATTSAGAIRRQPAIQSERVHPYARPTAGASTSTGEFHSLLSALQAPPRVTATAAAARQGLPAFGLLVDLSQEQITAALASGSSFTLRGNADTCNANNLDAFFRAFSVFTGLTWNGQYTGVSVQGREDRSIAGRGSISGSSLFFSDEAIRRCASPEIRELMQRVNNEQNAAHRAFLLLKVLDAFNEITIFWSRALSTIRVLLGQTLRSGTSWEQSRPLMPTAAARQAAPAAALTLYLP
ncbi:MAG: hypothetical protein ACRC9R_08955, partial [Enterovibrio sp.]